jgi:Cys-rich protein (TIGR01571 family)
MDISAERDDDGYHHDGTSSRRSSSGRWKDGTCNWCQLYYCACCCTTIALSQVMTRLQLNWLAQPLATTYRPKYSACRVVTAIVIAVMLLHILAANGHGNKNASLIVGIMKVVSLPLMVWVIYIQYKTRKTIRARYQIREECFPGAEDCACAFCCPVWSVIQMSRQTGNFDRQRASCCSETGLEDPMDIV